MKTYKAGERLFCDFAFGGKPEAICIEVIEPGQGRSATQGQIRVRLTKTAGAYHKGEILIVRACDAVPKAQELRLTPGQFFRRISTDYEWAK